ncbi:MAG: rod shape-determining protein RodA [Candidatus Marinimicrobia bacterium]|nr:rod shape-determining protein RodA [Candidatus Neomarinimicrobiota bacterium]
MPSFLIAKIKEAPLLLLATSLVLTIIGIVTIGSVSRNQALAFTSTSFFRQLIWVLPALVLFFVSFSVSKKNIYKFTPYVYIFIILLLFVPYFGKPVAGTYRWISFGSLHLQPSEYAKFIIVLVLARYLSKSNAHLEKIRIVVMPIILTVIPTMIVLRQPDLGSAIIMTSPVIVMMFWAGVRPYHLFLILAPFLSVLTAFHSISFWVWAIILLIILYISRPTLMKGVIIYFANIFLGLLSPTIWNMLKPYQQRRFIAVLDPSLDPLGAGYQIIQSQTAIGSGGFFGKGWGQGTQTQLKYLPVQETDFIVSVIGEEFGFITIFIILILFGWMILRMLKLAHETDNRFSGLVIIGIAVLFLTHVFVNIAMAAGMIPVKGLPLPFLSYGGSFLISCFMMVGLVMNLSINYSE